MKTLALAIGLFIGLVGASGLLAPSGLAWIAQHAVTSGAFYLIAVVRISFGLVFVSAAAVSRAPRTLRVIGWLIVIAGIVTAVMGLVGMELARGIIQWWQQQGLAVVRLVSVVILAFGSFVAYLCSSGRRRA